MNDTMTFSVYLNQLDDEKEANEGENDNDGVEQDQEKVKWNSYWKTQGAES